MWVGVAQEPPHHLISISHEYYRNLPIATILYNKNKLKASAQLRNGNTQSRYKSKTTAMPP